MIKLLFIAVIMFVFSACDDSIFIEGTDINTAEDQNISFGGIIVDGYISGATVCLDFDTNDLCDENEPTTISDENGIFSFVSEDLNTYDFIQIIASGGTDTATNKDFNGELKSIVNTSTLSQNSSLIINPLTDLVAISFLRSIIRDNLSLQNSISKIAEVLTIESVDVLKDPMQDVKIFAKVQQIQHLKRLIETSVAKVYDHNNGKNLTKEIKKALVTQIQESSDGALKLNRVLDTVEVALNITIAANEKTFILSQIEEITQSLDTFVIDENIDIRTLARLQLTLERELESAYSILENANDINDSDNLFIEIADVNITYEHITQSVFQKIDAILDEQACIEVDAYNMLSDTSYETNTSYETAYTSDLENGITLNSKYSYNEDVEKSVIKIYYTDLISTKTYEKTTVYLANNESYFSFDHAWLDNHNNTVYIRTPKDDNNLYGCYKAELSSTDSTQITLTKVYRFADI